MPQAQQVIDEIQEEAKNFNRIFIASIHPDLTEEDIKSVFEAFGPIQFCRLAAGNSLHSHKGYGFIEYATKQAMDEAIASMNLFDLGGQLLRVGRAITPPNALMGPVLNSAMPTAAAVAAAAATAKIQAMEVVATHASVGGLETLMRAAVARSNFDQDSVAAVVAAAAAAAAAVTAAAASGGAVPSPNRFGSPATHAESQAQLSPAALQPPNLVTPVLGSAGHIHVPAATAVSGPAVEPVAAAAAAAAAATAHLNNLHQQQSLALHQHHQQLQAANAHAGVALLPNPPGVAALMSLGGVGGLSVVGGGVDHAHLRSKQEELQKKLLEEGEPQTLQQQETMSIKGQNARHLVMQRLMRPSDSKVVILRNMVGPEDVDEMLKEEIQDECSKFGAVERVIIYNEKQTDNEDDADAEIVVKIFVEFSMACETEAARDALNGRYFGGRMVKAEMYDQALFDHGDLSG